MNDLALSLPGAIILGLGATLTTDLWGLFLKRAFRISLSNMCLVGRWILYMPEGIFRHSSIGSAPQKSAECTVGWISHYLIGITFAMVFVAVAGSKWFQHPAPIPALSFGVVTVLAPFILMQPAMGLGLAGSRLPNPSQARLRSLMNHGVFGAGLYLFGWLVNWFVF